MLNTYKAVADRLHASTVYCGCKHQNRCQLHLAEAHYERAQQVCTGPQDAVLTFSNSTFLVHHWCCSYVSRYRGPSSESACALWLQVLKGAWLRRIAGWCQSASEVRATCLSLNTGIVPAAACLLLAWRRRALW